MKTEEDKSHGDVLIDSFEYSVLHGGAVGGGEKLRRSRKRLADYILKLEAERDSCKEAYEIADAETRGLRVTVDDITGQPGRRCDPLAEGCVSRRAVDDSRRKAGIAKRQGARAALDAVLGR